MFERCSLPPKRLLTNCLVWIGLFQALGTVSGQAPPSSQSAVSVSAFVPTSHPQAAVLETMWRTGLFDSAVGYCEQQIELVEPNTNQHARWMMFAIRAYTERALSDLANGGKPDEEFAKITEILDQANRGTTPHPRLLWIRWQALQSQLSLAQSELADYLANPADQASRELTLATIRKLDTELDLADQEVKKQAELASTNSKLDGKVLSEELLELTIELILLRSEAMRVRGQAYPIASTDAIAAGDRIVELVDQASSRAPSDWSGRPRLQLMKLAGKLMQGRQSIDDPIFAELLKSSDSSLIRKVIPIAIQAAILSDNLPTAKQILAETQSQANWPEWSMAELQVALAEVAKEPADSTNRNKRLQEAISLRSRIGDRFGSYWQRRAEAMLASAGAKDNSSTNKPSNDTAVDLLLIEAKQFLELSDWKNAAAKLAQASGIAESTGSNTQALELAGKSAAVLLKSGNARDAAKQFITAAEKFEQEPQAAAFHLTGIFQYAEFLKRREATDADREAYEKALTAHLSKWPNDETTVDAMNWISRCYRNQGNLGVAIESLLTLCESRDNPTDVVAELVKLSLEHSLLTTVSLDARTDRIRKTLSAFQSMRTANATRWETNQLGTIISAENSLQLLLPDDLKVSVIGLPPSLDIPKLASLSRDASTLSQKLNSLCLIIEAAQQNRIGEVDDRLKQLDDLSGDTPVPFEFVAACLVSAIDVVDSLPANDRVKWGKPLGRLFELCKQSADFASAAKPVKKELEIVRRRLDAWNGQRTEAAAWLIAARKEQPRDVALALALASILEEGDSKEQEEALNVFRQIAAGSKSGTSVWLTARYRMANLLIAIGQREKARELAQVVLAAQNIPNSVWRSRFESIAGNPATSQP